MTSPASPRKQVGLGRALGGCAFVGATLFAVLLAAGFLLSGAMTLFWTRLDQRRFPWGYTGSGRPTLVGRWTGTLVTGGGTRFGLLVDLRMAPAVVLSARGRMRVRSDSDSKLQGEARLCTARGEVQRFTVGGDTEDDRRASRFYLVLLPVEDLPRDGLTPSHLRGRWDGGDALAFEADVHQREGSASITRSDDPDTGRPGRVEMRRGDEAEFGAACAGLRR